MTHKTANPEIALINRFFKDYHINASVAERNSHIAGKAYIVLGITLGAGARINAIEARLRELAELLSAHRGAPTPIRLRQLPLALELPHPRPDPVVPVINPNLQPHTMLCGQAYSFDGAMSTEMVDLTQTPHALVSGTTGSGKSVLLACMLWSLCLRTAPADVQLVLVDLKNEDLIPFADLPHTLWFAADTRGAEEAIAWLYDEKERRVRSRDRRKRIVLVIDELAELSRSKDTMAQLASILAIGRSKAVNVVAATQKPLGAVVGSLAKANFTTRLVGRVMSNDDARVAAGVSGTGAEYLPGRGSFLRVEGMETRRFQSYWLPDLDARIAQIADRWTEQLPINRAWVVAPATFEEVQL